MIGRKSPSHAVQSEQEKWKCVVLKKTKKQASTQPEAAEKCHLVLPCLCDHILGLE